MQGGQVMAGLAMAGGSRPQATRKPASDRRAMCGWTVKLRLQVSETVEWQFCPKFEDFQTEWPFLPQLCTRLAILNVLGDKFTPLTGLSNDCFSPIHVHLVATKPAFLYAVIVQV